MHSILSDLGSVSLPHYLLYLFCVGLVVIALWFLSKKFVKDSIEFPTLKYLKFFPRRKSKAWIFSSILILLTVLSFGFLILMPSARDGYSHTEESSDESGVLMVIMDVSGSMSSRHRLTKEAFRELVDLADGKEIGLVIYSDEAYLSRLADDKEILLSDFVEKDSGGLYSSRDPWDVISSGTNTAVAVYATKDHLQKHFPDKENTVVIFSDFEDEPNDVVPALRDLKESIKGLKLYLVGIDKAPSYGEARRARIFLGVRDFWVDGIYEITNETELLSAKTFFTQLLPDSPSRNEKDAGGPPIIRDINDTVLWLGIAVLGFVGLTVLVKEVILRRIP